jgi:hypothetical protein
MLSSISLIAQSPSEIKKSRVLKGSWTTRLSLCALWDYLTRLNPCFKAISIVLSSETWAGLLENKSKQNTLDGLHDSKSYYLHYAFISFFPIAHISEHFYYTQEKFEFFVSVLLTQTIFIGYALYKFLWFPDTKTTYRFSVGETHNFSGKVNKERDN